tara:strand:- start:4539 stop:4793 length:255 start_codon:yes stop_codon:yes gene_type:complete
MFSNDEIQRLQACLISLGNVTTNENIKIGDHYQGDDYLFRVTKLEGLFNREGLIKTQVTFTAIENPLIWHTRYASDLNQFYKVK